MQNVKAIPGEFQHVLVITDINKKESSEKGMSERRKISLLKDVKVGKRF